MKNKKIIYSLRTILLVGIIILLMGIVSAESCFVRININEIKNEEGIITFSLDSIENLYGSYVSSIEGIDRNVNVYDGANNLIAKYGFSSPRFIITEIFGDNSDILIDEYEIEIGGDIIFDGIIGDEFLVGESRVIESDSGIASLIIPYDNSIGSIAIESDGVETNLGSISGQISCTRTCLNEGESGVYGETSCCSDYNAISIDDSRFGCVNIGDDICSQYENYRNSLDCAGVCPEEYGQDCRFSICGDNVCDDYELFDNYCSLDCPLSLGDIQGYIGDWVSGDLSFPRILKVVDNYVNL